MWWCGASCGGVVPHVVSVVVWCIVWWCDASCGGRGGVESCVVGVVVVVVEGVVGVQAWERRVAKADVRVCRLSLLHAMCATFFCLWRTCVLPLHAIHPTTRHTPHYTPYTPLHAIHPTNFSCR